MPLRKDQVSKIRNKMRREKLLATIRHTENKTKREQRKRRSRAEKADPSLREKRLAENVPATIESMRRFDESIGAEISHDEFDTYFQGKAPKVFVTTSKFPHKEAYEFAELLIEIFPTAEFFRRKPQFEMPDIARLCAKRDYTDVVVVNEDQHRVTGLTFIHLPDGPTFYFSVSSLIMPQRLKGHGSATDHVPELILNNFSTRLGKTVGRLFQSLLPQQPEFQGRQVVTLHNQRDFIFFRRHRYLFKNEQRVGLQELGPQFTLRLRRIQKGIRDEISWEHQASMDKDKKKFWL